jgi:phage repressor protein C with HTH and peptisase S24 domain
MVPLMGYIGAGAEIEPEFEQTPPDGLDQIWVPFPMPEEMIALEVRGVSMLPIYKPGHVVICYAQQKRPLEAFFGEEAAVRTSDGRRFLKTVMRGAEGVNLMSFNAPMIENVSLEWIGEIFAVLPKTSVRHIERKGGIQGRLI